MESWEILNAGRKARAYRALAAYQTAGGGDPDDEPTSIVDLITDLAHLYGHDDALARAQRHYSAEVSEDVSAVEL